MSKEKKAPKRAKKPELIYERMALIMKEMPAIDKEFIKRLNSSVSILSAMLVEPRTSTKSMVNSISAPPGIWDVKE